MSLSRPVEPAVADRLDDASKTVRLRREWPETARLWRCMEAQGPDRTRQARSAGVERINGRERVRER